MIIWNEASYGNINICSMPLLYLIFSLILMFLPLLLFWGAVQGAKHILRDGCSWKVGNG